MEVTALAEAPATHVRAVDPDAELVAAARAEPRAFLALYDRYFERVLAYARLRIRDAATCEDVTSHVFTTALAQLPRFRARLPTQASFPRAEARFVRPWARRCSVARRHRSLAWRSVVRA
jgi:DNA-directed RNA polymerase specialized sigma24 family protein